MATQFLSPVSSDAVLKFQIHAGCDRFRSPFSPNMLHRPAPSRRGDTRKGGKNYGKRSYSTISASVSSSSNDSTTKPDVADDYYAVLGLLPDATAEEIKKAYYSCMKACHPDLSGNDNPDTSNFCMFVNEIYAVLSDPVQRMVYDEIHGYAATATNPFLDTGCSKDQAFVDEFSCIGCKNCASVAPDVFRIEEDFGRARVCSQTGDFDLVQQAIDSCPVDCIYWTSAAQLSLLEDEMRRVERVNVGLMLAGMGSSSDVFRMARTRWEKRQLKALEKARMQMMRQESDGKESYWEDLWGKRNDNKPPAPEAEVEERVKRVAAAARRWREYSRRGVDKPPTFKLPEISLSTKDK